jgi:hypothetical protein
VVVEALTNVRRHAPAASRVVVTVTAEPGTVRVSVEDDGLVAEGHGNADIAGALHISAGTAKNHVAALRRKLGVRNGNRGCATPSGATPTGLIVLYGLGAGWPPRSVRVTVGALRTVTEILFSAVKMARSDQCCYSVLPHSVGCKAYSGNVLRAADSSGGQGCATL